MKIKLDWRKSAQENASAAYQSAKDAAAKEAGARDAIEKTKIEIVLAMADKTKTEAERKAPEMRRKREWYEKFRWFFTSGGKLAVAGRDAMQNDLLVAKSMNESDLFFHADIQGAPATILVGGKEASQQEKIETAQFAASHSSAWKVGAASVDVYAVEKGQLSKHAQGGYVGAGGFAISGEREWFRSTPLGLAIGLKEGIVVCLPAVHPDSPGLPFVLSPGAIEKGQAAKKISAALKASADELLLALPSGKFSLKQRK